MIFDELIHLPLYMDAELAETILSFVRGLSASAEEKKYTLNGEQLFATVMSYETKEPGDCAVESHEKYIDIQLMLWGREELDAFPAESLRPTGPYDAKRDLRFYEPPKAIPVGCRMEPGFFALLLPHDAHRSQKISDNGKEVVKKVVVKVHRDLITKPIMQR